MFYQQGRYKLVAKAAKEALTVAEKTFTYRGIASSRSLEVKRQRDRLLLLYQFKKGNVSAK
jgi:hypothetical protein